MIFRQLFDPISYTYTYILGSRTGGEALIIDPVLEDVKKYLKLLEELNVKLVKVIDTHIHADHISGIAELRDKTNCITIMGDFLIENALEGQYWIGGMHYLRSVTKMAYGESSNCVATIPTSIVPP